MGALYLFGRCVLLPFCSYPLKRPVCFSCSAQQFFSRQSCNILLHARNRRTATASDILPIAFSIPALLHAAWVVGFLAVYRPGPHLPHVACALSLRASRQASPDAVVAGLFALTCTTLVLLAVLILTCLRGIFLATHPSACR